MRLWSLHPRFLDRQGLVACWRESLLAQAVLLGRTRGYRAHPQLERFRASLEPVAAIGAYLIPLADEAAARGYRFDRSRIATPARDNTTPPARLSVTSGQLDAEWAHLLAKLVARSPQRFAAQRTAKPRPHPLFEVVPGPVEPWERMR